MKKQDRKLGYSESKEALAIRIKAHVDYSNFSLEDWMRGNLPFCADDVILDVGCGSGNLFPVYADLMNQKGVVVGLDQSPDLLAEAKSLDLSIPSLLMQWNLNKPLPFVNHSFKYVISTFAIYYADDVKLMMQEIHRLLEPGGKFFLIGPTDKNASELYEFNKEVFGFDCDERVLLRTKRLEDEFFPVASEMFNDVELEKIPSKLIFPSGEDFLNYYRATLLYEESLVKSGKTSSEIVFPSLLNSKPELSKEMIVMWGQK